MSSAKNVFFGSDIFRNSLYGDKHPLNIARVWPAIDICQAEGWLDVGDYYEIPPAAQDVLADFHDRDYIDALWQAERNQDLPDALKDKYQIGRASNPIFTEIYSRPATAANASLIGAQWLIEGRADAVFNPSGGTHHGKKKAANGFCFVNDPAIALDVLAAHSDAPLTYIDIDAHHCDGVQDWHTDTVQLQIISLHQADLWPRTGQEGDRGGGNAYNFTLPPESGDEAALALMTDVILPLIATHQPRYLVLQAGADGLKDDPQSKLAYSLQGYWQMIEMILAIPCKKLILGGGGYNPYLTAKAWAGIWPLLTKQLTADSLAKTPLSQASTKLLKALSWHHRLGRNPPDSWFTHFGDR